jgi:hypothetical protein
MPFDPVAPVDPVEPFAPVAPTKPCAPAAPVAPGAPVTPVPPVAPVAPAGPFVVVAAASAMSNSGRCPVWLFSLLSNCTTALAELRASPKFVAGAFTHPCTVAVTSNVTNAPADACPIPTVGPSEGTVAYVTLASFQVDPTACTVTAPGVSERLQYTRNVARVICADVVPAGNTPRSNCTSAVYPLPTFRLLRLPAFTVGLALETCASPTSVACCDNARTAASARPRDTSARRLRVRSSPLNQETSQQQRSQLSDAHCRRALRLRHADLTWNVQFVAVFPNKRKTCETMHHGLHCFQQQRASLRRSPSSPALRVCP